MTEQLQLRVDPATAASELRLTALASTRLNIDANRIKGIRIIKRSIDARQRNVMINLTLLAYVDEDPSATLFAPELYDRLPESAPAAVVVGAGHAGLFAALRLIQLGIKPIVIERGKDVDSRRIDILGCHERGSSILTPTTVSAKEAQEPIPTGNSTPAAKNGATPIGYYGFSASTAHRPTYWQTHIHI